MLAEMFESDLRQCSQTGKTDLPPAPNLLELYDQFVERNLLSRKVKNLHDKCCTAGYL
jgi:hypothetical protein